MVLVGISVRGKSEQIYVHGNLNIQRYIDQVLTPVVVPYIQNTRNITFMDDNAPSHRARIVNNVLMQHHISELLSG